MIFLAQSICALCFVHHFYVRITSHLIVLSASRNDPVWLSRHIVTLFLVTLQFSIGQLASLTLYGTTAVQICDILQKSIDMWLISAPVSISARSGTQLKNPRATRTPLSEGQIGSPSEFDTEGCEFRP